MRRKQKKEFFLSVAGETELWYFEHLQTLINGYEPALFKVKLHAKVESSPLSFLKVRAHPFGATLFHVLDYESNSEQHRREFANALSELRQANRASNVNYIIGYTNLSFELWILLHKAFFNRSAVDNTDYCEDINQLYHTDFSRLKEYKKEDNFKGKILAQIDLGDVVQAVAHSHALREFNRENGNESRTENNFMYYTQNPDLTIHECVQRILNECGVPNQT